jgi:long-chain acyl-CoA synthetase
VREAVQGLEHVEWIAVLGGRDDAARSPREYALENFLERHEQPAIAEMDPDDVALMLYTSGTTGRPKGVMLTHANLLAQGEAGLDAAEYPHRDHPIISINALPMAHIFGVGAMNASYMLPGEYAKGAYTVQEAWFDAERFMQLIDEHRCSDMSCVPTMLALLLSHPKVNEYDLRSLRVINVGAAPVPVDLARAFSVRTGCRIRQLYGMTENAGIATCDRISRAYRPGSAGLPYKGVELRIVDDQGKPLPAGTPGEIVTRGPTTMKGYFKQPDVTAETIRDGWLHTGDIGKLDEDGWLYVVDRKKDMIIKGGENIFPAEIENALYELDGVAEAAVVGVPHEVYGEDVVAFVVLKPGRELSEAAAVAHVKTLVSAFKAPSRVHFVAQLPKSGVGKILRRELREQAKAIVS